MKVLAIAALVAGVGLYAWRRRRRHRQRHLSAAWLEARRRADIASAAHVEGPAWRWPINKIVNEAGYFNSKKHRRRA